MRLRDLSMIAALTLLNAACGNDGGDGAARPTPMPSSVPGVYAGRWPCSNCAAIDATLWLRADGAFVMRQAFSDEAATAGLETETRYGLGRWSWDEQAAEIVLRGAGPERRLAVHGPDALLLRVSSPLPHRLERDPTAPPFADRVNLDGESVVAKDGATFTECLTGLTLPVAASGAVAELRRQHRVLNPRGRIALTTIEGRLVHMAADGDTDGVGQEALVIERVVAMKPGTGCRD